MLELTESQEMNLSYVSRLILEQVQLRVRKTPSRYREDIDEWFECTDNESTREFDINITYDSYDDNPLWHVGIYECHKDEQGYWNTDLSKQLSYHKE